MKTKLERLEPIRHYVTSDDLREAHNELVKVINTMAGIIEAQAAIIDELTAPRLQISAADPRQTFVQDKRGGSRL